MLHDHIVEKVYVVFLRLRMLLLSLSEDSTNSLFVKMVWSGCMVTSSLLLVALRLGAGSHQTGRPIYWNFLWSWTLLIEYYIDVFQVNGRFGHRDADVAWLGLLGVSSAYASHTPSIIRRRGIIKMQYKTNTNRRSRLAEVGAGSLTQSLVQSHPRQEPYKQLPYNLDP